MAKETIAILGGTGDLGTGLAIRWAKAGHRIVIGSRTLQKAQKAVADLQAISPQTAADAMQNPDAAAAGQVVVLTVPAAHQLSTLETVRAGLAGKILVDVTVPLVPPRVGTVQLPGEGSAGKRAQDFLGSRVKVGDGVPERRGAPAERRCRHRVRRAGVRQQALGAAEGRRARRSCRHEGLARRPHRELGGRRGAHQRTHPDQPTALDFPLRHQDRRPRLGAPREARSSLLRNSAPVVNSTHP